MEVKDYIIYHSAGNLYWKDLNNRYLGCNKNYADILELPSPQAIVGLTDADIPRHQQFMTADEIQLLTDVDNIVLRTGVTKVVEERGLNRKGKKAAYLTIKKPIKDASGNIIGLMGTSIDITPVKRVEKLKKQQEVTNKVVQKLKAVSAGLSYEIRNPLAGIRLGLGRTKQFLNILSRLVKSMGGNIKSRYGGEITLEEIIQHQQLLTKMEQRIDTSIVLMEIQLKNMITDHIKQHFFQYHRIKHGIEQAVATFPLDNEALRNKIHVNIRHNFIIHGDALLTKHIIWNLLNNALHFIKETDRGEIFITTGQRGQQYFVSVKDTAKGMSPEQAKKVFEQFYTNREGGSGLGLSFCALVMESYGGAITCTAVEGEYAEFLLFFPIITAPDETMTPTGMVAKANT